MEGKLRNQNSSENPIKPSMTLTQADEAQVRLLNDQGGVRPLPRRDHQALLINKDSQLLIYGGKNDNAFSYTVDNLDSDKIDTDRIHNAIYDEIKSTNKSGVWRGIEETSTRLKLNLRKKWRQKLVLSFHRRK